MKRFILKAVPFLCLSLILTACAPSAPSNDDVLSAYKNWVAYRQKSGASALPLPPQAIVDHCEKDDNPPLSKGVFFDCYIKRGGASDTNVNPVKLQRGPDGTWSMWD